MPLKVMTNQIDVTRVFDLQRRQRMECLPMSGDVPASGALLAKTTVSNQGHFYCLFLTGSYTTIYGPGAVATDDGVNHLRGKLLENNTPIFNDFIPFDLWVTPGRRKSALDLTGAGSNNLYVLMPIEHLFPANSDILLDCRTDATYQNSFSLAFWGIRVNAAAAVSSRVSK